MIPELGQFALILALILALTQGTLPLVGAARGLSSWMNLARPAAQGQFVFIAIAFGCLTYSFVNNDFSVLYVASNSNSALPLHYRIAAVWGGHEGSLLLWVLMLSLWTMAVSVFSSHLPDDIVARVLAVLGLISVGFLSFMLFTSNPFDRLLPAAMDGRDLNPLLQDPGMVIHPPMLYMGYVGFSVAFAFAMSALIGPARRHLGALVAAVDDDRVDVSDAGHRARQLVGVLRAGLGRLVVLGSGGERLLHAVAGGHGADSFAGGDRKARRLQKLDGAAGDFAFALSLLGTFLVRSGVLTSVHAFATDPKRGVFILAFLAVVIGGSLTLFAWRAHRIGLGGRFDVVSRESFLLSNNVLLVVAAGSVFLGTLYPLFIDALGLGKLSVGPPYFETVFVPLMAPALFLMGVGPAARWKQASLPELAVRLKWAFAVSVAGALLLPLTMGKWTPLASFGILLALWIVASSVATLIARLKQTPGPGIRAKLRAQSRSYYGMLLAHIGVAVFVVGVTMVKSYEAEKDVRMAIGDTVELGGYTFPLRCAE